MKMIPAEAITANLKIHRKGVGFLFAQLFFFSYFFKTDHVNTVKKMLQEFCIYLSKGHAHSKKLGIVFDCLCSMLNHAFTDYGITLKFSIYLELYLGSFLYYIKNGLQNLFSFAGNGDRSDVDVSVMRPILDYGLGQGWSLGSSEMSFACDWQAGRWSSLATGPR